MADANKVIEVLKKHIGDLTVQAAIARVEMEEMQEKLMAEAGRVPVDVEVVDSEA